VCLLASPDFCGAWLIGPAHPPLPPPLAQAYCLVCHGRKRPALASEPVICLGQAVLEYADVMTSLNSPSNLTVIGAPSPVYGLRRSPGITDALVDRPCH
jgi:hypothetical protein